MLNVAPQKERIPDHLRAMAEQDDKSAASGKTGEQSSIRLHKAPACALRASLCSPSPTHRGQLDTRVYSAKED